MKPKPEGMFGWDLAAYVLTGQSQFCIFNVAPDMDELEEKKLENNIKRFNNHQTSKREVAAKLAGYVRADVDTKTKEKTTPSLQGNRIGLAMVEAPKRLGDDYTTAEAIKVTQRVVRRDELIPDKDGLIALPRRIFTDGEPLRTLQFVNEAQHRNQKRVADEAAAPKSKRTVRMKSFGNLVTTFDELLDSRREFWRSEKIDDSQASYFPRVHITRQHVSTLLWQPYVEKQRVCCNSLIGTCRTQLEPGLKHPLSKDGAAMAYLSPMQREALVNGEPVEKFFNDPLCIFCNRYQILHQVLSDLCEIGDAVEEEIPSYYYVVNRVGEYDLAGCIQEHPAKTTRSLRGILGPVVTYNVSYFQPVVGIVSTNGWDMERVLSIEEYQRNKEQYKDAKIAYGWEETGPFYRLNNNALPVVDQVSPYERRYTVVRNGPFSASAVLQGYFKQRATTQMPNVGHLFQDLRKSLADDQFLLQPSPLFDADNVKYMMEQRQVINPDAEHPLDRYFPWRYVCMHKVDDAPPRETHRIYYTFLMVLNSTLHLIEKSKELTTPLPESIRKKLNIVLKSYDKLKTHFTEAADLSDVTFARLVYCPELKCNTSQLFVLYPRPAKVCCRIDDYEYLEYDVRVLARAKPDAVLAQLYASDVPIRVPHNPELLDKARHIDHLFDGIRLAHTGAYTTASAHFQSLHMELRQYTFVRWPVNSIALFAPVGTQEPEPESPEAIRRKSLKKHADSLIDFMKNAFSELLFLLTMENDRYRSLVSYIPKIVAPFEDVVKWIKDVVLYDGNARRLFKMIGVETFDSLLPIGFHTDFNGINGSHWLDNVYLLTCLVRVHILESLYQLEDPEQRQARTQLLLLSHAHFALVSVACERGPTNPVRNDFFLSLTAAVPSSILKRHFHAHYNPTMSLLTAAWPTPGREVHEGSIHNITSSLIYINFFDNEEMQHEPWRMQQLFKHRTSLKCTAYTRLRNLFAETDELDAVTPFRGFILSILELSWKGLWSHCTTAPGFRCAMQLDSIFRNADQQDVQSLLQNLFSTFEKRGDDKIKADTLLNNSVMEAISAYARACAPLRQMLEHVYKANIFQKAIASMEILRTMLNREESLELRRLYGISQRISIKYTDRITSPRKHSFVKTMCNIVRLADERRYVVKQMLAANQQITPREQHLIEAFIRKLHPRGILYAEDLQLVGMTESTIQCLSEIEDQQLDDSAASEITLNIFNTLPREQANIVAYFFEYLARYISFTPMRILNTDLLAQQARSICRICGAENLVDAAEGLTSAAISLCCSRWDKFPPTKQFTKKIINEDDPTVKVKYHSTLGNQSILFDPIAEQILCGSIQSKPGKRTNPKYYRRAQRQWEIMNGIVPADIDKDFVAISKTKIHSDASLVRIAQQRQLEGRTPYCPRSEVLTVDLRGVLIQCPAIKIPKEKKKKVQKENLEKKRKPDKIRIAPINRSSVLNVSKPPFFITPCCGLIGGYNLTAWGANGYVCGACLPKSNCEKALATEILCMGCNSVLPNRPSFNHCKQPDCVSFQNIKHRAACKHGASPILMYDDVYEQQMRLLYVCDSCMRMFRSVSPTTLLTLSSIKAQSLGVINKLLYEK